MIPVKTVQAPSFVAASSLRYDYGQIEEGSRKAVIGAATEIKAHESRAKESMIRIGQRLATVKGLLPHGQFADWCQVEFDMSDRTAQRMMAAAEVFGSKSDTVSLLSDSAMYLLSGPSVPEAARDEVIAVAREIGKSPTKAEVKEIIDAHKPPEDLAEKCRKLEFWLLGKGWGRSSGPNPTPDSMHKRGFPDLSWPKGDVTAGYEALRTAEKYERGQLPPPVVDSQKRAEAAAAPAVTPKPSVASQVIDLAERGMDAEIEAVLSASSPVDLRGAEKAIYAMMAELGEALTFSITIRDGEFSIYWCAPGVPVRNALGRGETLAEAWGALVSEARESKTK